MLTNAEHQGTNIPRVQTPKTGPERAPNRAKPISTMVQSNI